MSFRFDAVEDVSDRLGAAGYLADRAVATAAFLADRLDKPILAEGPAGTGKTELAKALARATGSELVRLQCYEGLDEAKTLFEWDYQKQLLRIQADRDGAGWDALQGDLFAEGFLLERPLLRAIRATGPVVLLIDEVDRVEVETEALLLEVLAEFQVTVPELGTLYAAGARRPLVVLTSNGTRDLSEALKRRCLFLHVDYPTLERELRIVRLRVPELEAALADQVVALVASLRAMDLRKAPSIAETLDWARTLVHLGAHHLDGQVVVETLSLLLKHQADITRARRELSLPAPRA